MCPGWCSPADRLVAIGAGGRGGGSSPRVAAQAEYGHHAAAGSGKKRAVARAIAPDERRVERARRCPRAHRPAPRCRARRAWRRRRRESCTRAAGPGAQAELEHRSVASGGTRACCRVLPDRCGACATGDGRGRVPRAPAGRDRRRGLDAPARAVGRRCGRSGPEFDRRSRTSAPRGDRTWSCAAPRARRVWRQGRRRRTPYDADVGALRGGFEQQVKDRGLLADALAARRASPDGGDRGRSFLAEAGSTSTKPSSACHRAPHARVWSAAARGPRRASSRHRGRAMTKRPSDFVLFEPRRRRAAPARAARRRSTGSSAAAAQVDPGRGPNAPGGNARIDVRHSGGASTSAPSSAQHHRAAAAAAERAAGHAG